MSYHKQVIVLCVAIFSVSCGWEYQPIPNLATSGIYTQEQIERALEPKGPVGNPVVQSDVVVGPQHSSGAPVTSKNNDYERQYSPGTWDRLITAGTICACVISIYVCLKIIELVVKAVLYCRRQRGVERKELAAAIELRQKPDVEKAQEIRCNCANSILRNNVC